MTDDLTTDNQDMSSEELHELRLLLGISSDEDALFASYIDHIANDGLLPYKATIHYSETAGGKAGESLYNHVINGIFVLESLRKVVALTQDEAKVLFTAFTIHDINKMVEGETKYKKLATKELVIPKIRELKLDNFFPNYADYIEDILSLMKRHSGHLWEGIEAFDLRRATQYRIGDERLGKMVFLMRAADILDLSHTLDEQRHKTDFLVQLNNVSIEQYAFIIHRVAEQRGSFTNIAHNAVISEMRERFGLMALLLYPDGAVYLCPRGTLPEIDDIVITAIAQRIAAKINEMTSGGFQAFIRPINMGITIDRKCLDLNIPFGTLFDAILSIVQKRMLKADKLQQLADDSIKRTRKLLEKRSAASDPQSNTQLSAEIELFLETGPVPQTQDRMRIGELLRSYYIFLLEHFTNEVPTPWTRIYDIFDLPAERRAIYDCFEARMDRAYAIAVEIVLPEQDIIMRIKRDGSELLTIRQSADPRLPVLIEYLKHVLLFDSRLRNAADFAAAMPTYVKQQHKQCVQCSLPLPTQKWGSGNVRSDIKVQLFSNRLGGGPGEPVKRVCAICEMQFLVEKLNYREIRGEQTFYLHLFPYSFLTAPFLEGVRTTIKRITRSDHLAGALRLNDVDQSIHIAAQKNMPKLRFTTRTKENKAQPYGMYMPRYSDTLGGVITFPINPAGENDTERFLFILQHALLLHRHFGCKTLVSTSATPSLDKEAFGDIYFDLTPLSVRGLIRQNDYHEYQPGTKTPGSLRQLWEQLGWLFTIRARVATRKSDSVAELVIAMADHPLRVFYCAEKLAEEKARTDKGDAGWLLRAIADDVRLLALSIGGSAMRDLDEQLQRLAEIAWKGGLRGQSLEKNSIMAPMNEVLQKLSMQSPELTTSVLQAAAAQDLYEHIKRILDNSGRRYSPTRLQAASEEFVQVFFQEVFGAIYQGKVSRLISHEKILRSAFHLYIRRQIPRRDTSSNSSSTLSPEAIESSDTPLFPEM